MFFPRRADPSANTHGRFSPAPALGAKCWSRDLAPTLRPSYDCDICGTVLDSFPHIPHGIIIAEKASSVFMDSVGLLCVLFQRHKNGNSY